MTTTNDLVCWKCGAALADVPLPLSRLAECPACRTYLHACKACRFYDRNVAKQCTEQDAEEVVNKDWSNFCDYFQPRLGPHDAAAQAKAQSARAKLDTLFGGADAPASAADEARAKLDALFGKPKK